jgi:hypothetical protein
VALRAVLAAVLALALLGVSLPAVEEARQERAEETADRTATRIADAVESFARRNDPAGPGVAGARRTVRVTVPDGGFATADATVFVGGVPGQTGKRNDTRRDGIAVRVGGRVRVAATVGVDLRTREGTPLALRGDGYLTLWLRDDAVRVSRGRGREFKPENGTTARHAARPTAG